MRRLNGRLSIVVVCMAAAMVLASCKSDSSGNKNKAKSSDTSSATSGSGGTVAPATGIPADRFGIAAGVVVARADEAAMKRDLDGIKASGARWLRTTVKWNEVQPQSASSFDWSATDQLVDAARAEGLQLLLIVNGTPTWAGRNPAVEPTDPTDYANFLRAAVLRYKDKGVHHWELGNEPNHEPSPDPARYAALLKATYPAIKEADPAAFVLTGGLGGTENKGEKIAGDTFLQALYQQGAKGSFDALSYHPYTYPGLPSENARGWGAMLNARRIMEQNGDGNKPVWATEFGAPTGGPRKRVVVSDDKQALMVTDAYTTFVKYPWSGPLFWFSYRDKGTDEGSQKNFFGLVQQDWSPKEAYEVYRASTAKAS